MKSSRYKNFAEVLSGLLIVVMILIGIVAILGVFSGFHLFLSPDIQGYDVITSQVSIRPGKAGLVYQDASIHRNRAIVGDLTIAVLKDSRWVILARTIGTALQLALVFWIFWIVRKIVGTVIRNDVFSASNPGRFRLVGILLLVNIITNSIIYLADTHWLINNPIFKGVEAQYSLPFSLASFIAPGLLILLAEVFKRGLALQRDRELTI